MKRPYITKEFRESCPKCGRKMSEAIYFFGRPFVSASHEKDSAETPVHYSYISQHVGGICVHCALKKGRNQKILGFIIMILTVVSLVVFGELFPSINSVPTLLFVAVAIVYVGIAFAGLYGMIRLLLECQEFKWCRKIDDPSSQKSRMSQIFVNRFAREDIPEGFHVFGVSVYEKTVEHAGAFPQYVPLNSPATLTIFRDRKFMACLAPMTVKLGGVQVAVINNGCSATVPIMQKHNTLQIYTDETLSDIFEFEAQDGAYGELHVSVYSVKPKSLTWK